MVWKEFKNNMKKRKIGDEVWSYDTLHNTILCGKVLREILEDRGWLWGYEIQYDNYKTVSQPIENIVDSESSARTKFKKYLKDKITHYKIQIKHLEEVLSKEPK